MRALQELSPLIESTLGSAFQKRIGNSSDLIFEAILDSFKTRTAIGRMRISSIEGRIYSEPQLVICDSSISVYRDLELNCPVEPQLPKFAAKRVGEMRKLFQHDLGMVDIASIFTSNRKFGSPVEISKFDENAMRAHFSLVAYNFSELPTKLLRGIMRLIDVNKPVEVQHFIWSPHLVPIGE